MEEKEEAPSKFEIVMTILVLVTYFICFSYISIVLSMISISVIAHTSRVVWYLTKKAVS